MSSGAASDMGPEAHAASGTFKPISRARPAGSDL